MASSAASSSSIIAKRVGIEVYNNYTKLIKKSPEIVRAAELVRQDVFGHRPQLNVKSGSKNAKIGFTGPYIARYYPESINVTARKVFPGWESEQEEYRRIKRIQQRRKGKGPPKKGEGKRSKK